MYWEKQKENCIKEKFHETFLGAGVHVKQAQYSDIEC
jgi:hypothetical protein